MIKNLIWLVGFGLLWPVAAKADTDLPPWLTERRIIGHDDLEPIEDVRNTKEYDMERIVARVETRDGHGFCTASRVGKDLFLTNFHCYDYKPCDNIQFHLGYEKALSGADQLLFNCKEVLAKNETYDYALYRVEFAGALAGEGKTETHAFKNLDLAIPDNDEHGVTKELQIDQPGTLTDLKVHLKIDHPYVGDLIVELTAPSGKSTTLMNQDGSTQSGVDQTFTLGDGLMVFRGETAAGTWKLLVKDVGAGDKGKLQEVDLIITAKDSTATVTSDTQEARPELMTPADYPVATLWTGPITVGEELLIASHPGARMKEIDQSKDCKLRTITTEEVDGRQTITHTCDTEGGSSGSPVLDRATGHVVALHWGGTDDYNLAIPMSKVVADIEKNAPEGVVSEMHIEH